MPLPGQTSNEFADRLRPLSHREITVGIHTLGCRLNQYESDGILNQFLRHHYRVVPVSEGPDIVVVNTCTVTEQADARNRNIIRSMLRKNPSSRVFVTGCYAQTDAEKILGIEGVRGVVGNDFKADLFRFIEEYLEREKLSGAEPPTPAVLSGGSMVPSLSGRRPVLADAFAYGDVFPVDRSRGYLKIQDGCDRRCSYCKVPRARGGGISRSHREILEHARRMDAAGIPEIVLTGVNLGWYRDEIRLPELLMKILNLLGHSRLRLSSIEPSDVNERIAEISQHPRFCNFLHVPVQSGSADVLRRMKRSYNPSTFLRRIEKVRSLNPDVFLGTDVMVGFPGETDADFEATMSILRDVDASGIHAFPFSPRPGTIAAGLPGRVRGPVVRGRMKILAAFREEAQDRFYRRMNGKIVEGIVEGSDERRMGDPVDVLTGEFLRLTVDGSVVAKRGDILTLRAQAEGRKGLLVSRPGC